ncbi:type II secretion system F family protein [Cytobacillus sp. FJAT-54145]|uniref:Type II secretion system F family protein n=1 Tax=Cytobacillus spartinae TaxID=3299023 RepID=A0ABW6KC29_9BACI
MIQNPVLVWFLIVIVSVLVGLELDRLRKQRQKDYLDAMTAPDVDGMAQLLAKTRDEQPTTWAERKTYELQQSGMGLTLARYMVITLMLAVLAGSFIFFMLGSIYLAIGAGFAATLVPRSFVNSRRKKMLEEFSRHFRNTLIRMSSMIRAGGSVKQAVYDVAKSRDAHDMIRNEFKLVHTDLEYGFTAEEAFYRMYNRTGLGEVKLLSTIVEIQRQKGGNLAELLDSMQLTISEAYNQKREVKTLTAQVRSQATLLTAMPFCVIGFFMIINPSYYRNFVNDPIGIVIMIIAIGMILTGNFLMRKMAEPK